jgi:hypothetical protein
MGVGLQEVLSRRMSSEDIVSIGATCIVKINGKFFLLVEIEVEDIQLEEFVFIRLSRCEAEKLLCEGIERCEIASRAPANGELKCILIIGDNAFAVFDVENAEDEAVLVRISLNRARILIRRGVMKCTVIKR